MHRRKTENREEKVQKEVGINKNEQTGIIKERVRERSKSRILKKKKKCKGI